MPLQSLAICERIGHVTNQGPDMRLVARVSGRGVHGSTLRTLQAETPLNITKIIENILSKTKNSGPTYDS